MPPKNQLTFEIVKKGGPQDLEAAFLCEDVLEKSLQANDKNQIRVVGFFDGKICATATLIKQESLFKIQNVAVAPEMQNKGIGSMLLKFCEELVLENGVAAIYCHARDWAGRSAVNFFLKNEYFCRGEAFEEGGVVNQMMLKLLVE
ncbi:MAG: GNAT family N-acetyltransferase [Rickettsiales bacterium]|nr:GNAT family N-acetyltransferase [Rickettsiales bacterium]